MEKRLLFKYFSFKFLDLTQIKRKQLFQFIEEGRGSCIERKKHMENTIKDDEFSHPLLRNL